MRQEGRGIGLANKLRAYELQDRGADTVEANLALGLPVDKRDYGIGSQILVDLGVKEMRLITNNPRKIFGLEGYGLKIVGRVPMQTAADRYNRQYMETKRAKLGHMFDERWPQFVKRDGTRPSAARIAAGKRVAIVAARFYGELADQLDRRRAARALHDCQRARGRRRQRDRRPGLLRTAAGLPQARSIAIASTRWSRSASSFAAIRRTSTSSRANARAASWTCSSRRAFRSASAS